MKKSIKLIMPLMVLMVIGLIGCSKNNTSNADSSASSANSSTVKADSSAVKEKITVKDLKKSKETNDIDMSIQKAEYLSDKDLKNDERLVNISVAIKNNNSEEFGIGSGDFKIISKGKTYESIGTKENFGDVIKSTDTLEGKGSYVIPKDVKSGKIVYQPVNPQWSDMEKLEWSFTIE